MRQPGRAASPALHAVAARLVAFLIFCQIGAAFAAIAYPALTGRVNDGANVIPQAERASLDAKLADLENKSSIQLVVATVPSLQDTDVETFANGLFRAWKLGEAKQNNGVLLLVAPTEHKVRIEVGYGLEGIVTDALSSVIIQGAMLPRFRANDFAGGIDRGVDAIISALTNDQSEWRQKAQVRDDGDQDALDQIMPILVMLFFIFIIMVMLHNARGGGGGGGMGGRRGGVPWIVPTGGGFGGGGFSGGFGGGGFGGFSGGGGSSGGGGASGSW